ncbi:zinc-dependent metalloprotease [Arcanobacterium hippocoleae]
MNVSAKIAYALTKYLVDPGPAVAKYEAEAVVGELLAQAARAPKFVGEITGLTQAAQAAQKLPVIVLNRAKWAREIGGFIDGISARTSEVRIGMLGSIGSALMLGFASTKLLGQFDPFGANIGKVASAGTIQTASSAGMKYDAQTDGNASQNNARKPVSENMADAKLLLVAPNLAKFRKDYNLDRRDAALWVSVHELTHAVQFIHAPWLKSYLLTQIDQILNFDDDSNPALTDGGLKPIIERIQNIMSILEGHAQYVMNSVPINVMPSRNAIIHALNQKRKNSSWIQKKLTTFFGFDQKIAQYRRGEEFVKEVVERVGMDAFNKIWECPENFPSSAEFKNRSFGCGGWKS